MTATVTEIQPETESVEGEVVSPEENKAKALGKKGFFARQIQRGLKMAESGVNAVVSGARKIKRHLGPILLALVAMLVVAAFIWANVYLLMWVWAFSPVLFWVLLVLWVAPVVLGIIGGSVQVMTSSK